MGRYGFASTVVRNILKPIRWKQNESAWEHAENKIIKSLNKIEGILILKSNKYIIFLLFFRLL